MARRVTSRWKKPAASSNAPIRSNPWRGCCTWTGKPCGTSRMPQPMPAGWSRPKPPCGRSANGLAAWNGWPSRTWKATARFLRTGLRPPAGQPLRGRGSPVAGWSRPAPLPAPRPAAHASHIHGLAGRDHRSLAFVPPQALRAVLQELIQAGYRGVLTVEVFSEDDFLASRWKPSSAPRMTLEIPSPA